jgi:hypothetical protein
MFIISPVYATDMPRKNGQDTTVESSETDRRRFLQAVGALGVVGLAGCGGDDSGDTDTPGGGNGDGNGDTPSDTDTPTETESGGNGDTPTDTESGGNGDTPTDTDTPTETETPTPEPQVLPDPPRKLLTFDNSNVGIDAGGTVTLTGELQNPYLFSVQSVSVSLEAPNSDWTVEATGDTEFSEIATASSETVGWEVTAPDDVEGRQTFTATVDYATNADEASVTVETSLIAISGEVTTPITDGLIAQFDASQIDIDGAVSFWPDVSGSGAALTQESEGIQPSFESGAAPTGEPAVRFDAEEPESVTTDSPLTTATAGVTISVAFRIDDHTFPRQILAYNGSDTDTNGYGITVNKEGEKAGQLRVLYGGTAWFETGTNITDDDWHVVTMVIPDDNSGPSLYFDGSSVDPGGGSGTPAEPTQQFGIGDDRGTYNPVLDGDVGEEVVYEQALSDSDRSEVETYLEEKWVTGG